MIVYLSLGEMDLKAHVCIGMFLDMHSCCLSSVTAFCVRARSFQEGQVEVSPESLNCLRFVIVGFLGQDWQGPGTVPHAGSGVTVPGNLFWNVHGTGEWKLFLRGEFWVKPVYVYAHVCEEQLGDAEEGRLCACSLCQKMSAGLGSTLWNCSCALWAVTDQQ